MKLLSCEVENKGGGEKKPPYIGTWEDILGMKKFNAKSIFNFKFGGCYQIN